jgi:broad specificity phosphatase PhoE
MVRHQETLEGIWSGMGLADSNHGTHSQWNEFDFESLIAAYLAQHPNERPDSKAPAQEFSRLLRRTMQAWADDQIAVGTPETWTEFERRVDEGLSLATSKAESRSKILVVSSGGAISMALRQILKAPPGTMIQMNLQTRNSSYSHLYFNEHSIQLSGFNHIPHLDHPDRNNAVTYY